MNLVCGLRYIRIREVCSCGLWLQFFTLLFCFMRSAKLQQSWLIGDCNSENSDLLPNWNTFSKHKQCILGKLKIVNRHTCIPAFTGGSSGKAIAIGFTPFSSDFSSSSYYNYLPTLSARYLDTFFKLTSGHRQYTNKTSK